MNESDSNADTCCLRGNFAILQGTTKQVDVNACNKSMKPLRNVPIVSGAATHDDPESGETHALIIDEALHHDTKPNHLRVNPNQMQNFGINCWDNPFDKERGLSIGPLDFGLHAPLTADGTKVQFLSCASTLEELFQCPHIDLTSKDDCNPTEICLSQLSTSPGKPSEDLLNACPQAILLASPRSVSSQVSRSECDTVKFLPKFWLTNLPLALIM